MAVPHSGDLRTRTVKVYHKTKSGLRLMRIELKNSKKSALASAQALQTVREGLQYCMLRTTFPQPQQVGRLPWPGH